MVVGDLGWMVEAWKERKVEPSYTMESYGRQHPTMAETRRLGVHTTF